MDYADKWYVLAKNEPKGPLFASQIIKLINEKVIPKNVLVAKVGDDKWIRLEDTDRFSEFFRQDDFTPPPPPIPRDNSNSSNLSGSRVADTPNHGEIDVSAQDRDTTYTADIFSEEYIDSKYVKLFVGKDHSKYAERWRQAWAKRGSYKKVVRSLSWHWSAALFPVPWLAYRKMWLLCGVFAAGQLFVLILDKFIGGHQMAFGGVGIMVVTGLNAYTWYYGHVTSNIKKIVSKNLPPSETEEQIRSSGGVSWLASVVITAGYFMISLGIFLAGSDGALPTCSSSNARDTLRQAFDSSQFARIQQLSVVDIANMRDMGGTTTVRSCQANLTFNNLQRRDVRYKMELRNDGTYMLTFELR